MDSAKKLQELEEELEQLTEKKKKKPYSSITYTTGDIQKNIDHFNKMLSGKAENNHTDGYLNGTFKNSAAEKACKAVGTFAAASPDGASSISLGGGDSAGGEAGGACCEGYTLEEDAVFAPKAGMYFDLPKSIKLIPQAEVEYCIRHISTEQPFTIGYATPIYFYKKLLDKFVLIKCTEMTGFTGVDYRDASTQNLQQDQARLDKAEDQIAHPDVGDNGVVKSFIPGMRKKYGDVNKTVTQGDRVLYEIDPTTGKIARDADKKPIVKEVIKELKTILFYPMPGSQPKVKYFVDLKNGKGFVEIPRDMLEETIYEKVIEITTRDVANRTISREEDMTEDEIKFLRDVQGKVQAVLEQDAKTIDASVLSTGVKPHVRSLYTNQLYYLDDGNGKILGTKLMESLNEENLDEGKRYVRRYYMKPQEIFCSNKDEVLHNLIMHEDEDSIIYSLNRLGDVKDVSKLTPEDIIYHYEKGILYDKNYVRIMDYNLSIKHEEERPKVNPDTTSAAKFADIYADRLTDASDLGEAFNLDFDDVLLESKDEHKCCICGEEIEGYGNTPEPYHTAENGEKCCDACNLKFVIPARLDKAMNMKEEDK